MNPAVHPVDIVRVGASGEVAGRDVAATEEPLEIRLGSASFVTIMRTPGFDEQLAAGFLLSEQIVTRAATRSVRSAIAPTTTAARSATSSTCG